MLDPARKANTNTSRDSGHVWHLPTVGRTVLAQVRSRSQGPKPGGSSGVSARHVDLQLGSNLGPQRRASSIGELLLGDLGDPGGIFRKCLHSHTKIYIYKCSFTNAHGCYEDVVCMLRMLHLMQSAWNAFSVSKWKINHLLRRSQ